MTERFKPFCTVFLVLERDGKVLLQRRQNTGFRDGWYSLPSGHIEDGEPLRLAMSREAKEEICIDVRPEDLKLLHTLHSIGPADPAQYVTLYFGVDSWDGEPKIGEPEKCDELRWEAVDSLPENTLEYVRQALIAIKNGEIYGEFGWEDQRLTD